MSRSAIIRKTDTGYAGVYCNSDGYPSGVGATLLQHYSDPAKVAALIALGDLSILGERLDPLGATHRFGNAEKGTTVAYGRDRRESGCEPKIGNSIREVEREIGHNGHVYVFENGVWTHNGTPLADAVAADR